MVRDDHQPSARLQDLGGGGQHLLQCLHLLVHLYPQRLEHLGQLFLLALASEKRLHHFQEITNRGHPPLLAGFHQGSRQLAAVLQFTIQVEDIRQPLFVILVDDIGRGALRPFVHPHVQLAVETEGKAPFRVIEVVGRHAQVCQDGIHLLHLVVAQEIAQVAEIAAHEREPPVLHQVVLRVLILVETEQAAVRPHTS